VLNIKYMVSDHALLQFYLHHWQTCQNWWIVKRVIRDLSLSLSILLPLSPPYAFPSRPVLSVTFISFPYPFPSLSSPCPIPQIQLGSLGERCKSSRSVSGQSWAAKRILVQRRQKLGIGIWCWVDGLAKWVNIFTNLRNLQWGIFRTLNLRLLVVLTDNICEQGYFVNEQFNHFSRSCCWSNTLWSSHSCSK